MGFSTLPFCKQDDKTYEEWKEEHVGVSMAGRRCGGSHGRKTMWGFSWQVRLSLRARARLDGVACTLSQFIYVDKVHCLIESFEKYDGKFFNDEEEDDDDDDDETVKGIENAKEGGSDGNVHEGVDKKFIDDKGKQKGKHNVMRNIKFMQKMKVVMMINLLGIMKTIVIMKKNKMMKDEVWRGIIWNGRMLEKEKLVNNHRLS
uniref:Uncharacterized protein n=1 Tax=Lactuca sativa TaxID=4236 RepID=A0A9R1W0M0_LACSA|nr:hypothetical protein LSAT_V11C400223640 [Lactuca sativa]